MKCTKKTYNLITKKTSLLFVFSKLHVWFLELQTCWKCPFTCWLLFLWVSSTFQRFLPVSESLNHFHGPHEFIVLVENWPICHSRQSWPSLFIPGGSSFPGWFVRCAAWRIRLFCWSCFNDHSWLFKKTCYALLINALHNFKHKCLLFKSYMKKRQTHSHYFYEKKEKVCKLRIVTGQKCKTDEQKGYRIIHNGGELAVKIEVAGIQTDQEHT